MSELPELRFDIPHSARVWNYWLGGKDNYEADRKVGDAILEVYPAMRVLARQTRLFLRRSVRHLAGPTGVDQFLDIGTGLPTMENTHQVAQQVNPASRIVYVDNDPLVLAHARSLMVNVTPQGRTTYIHADVREPDAIIEQASEHLDLDRPVAVMLMGILGHATPDFADMLSVVRRLLAPLAPGSYLVLGDGINTDPRMRESMEINGYVLRTLDQLHECYTGLDLLEPGLVPAPEWRPDADGPPIVMDLPAICGVGRKPSDAGP